MTKQEDYLALVTKSGKRKLKASSLLPYGDDRSRFQATVLFHEAAELERQALSLLDDPSIEVRLGAAIERCACLVLGLDVVESTLAWREVEELSALLPAEVAGAHRDRLDPLVRGAQRDLQELLTGAPVLHAAKFRWDGVAPPERPRARAELAALLDRVPGDAGFHLIAARAAIDDERMDELRRAVERAHRLMPANPLLRASWLAVLGDVLAHPDAAMSRAAAEDELARTHEDLRRDPADAVVYLGFIFASLAAFFVTPPGHEAQLHRQRALWAAEAGVKQPSASSQEIHRYLEAAGPVIMLLTGQTDAVMGLFDMVVRGKLREFGIEGPLDRGPVQPTPADLIRGITWSAARRLTPSRALDLVA